LGELLLTSPERKHIILAFAHRGEAKCFLNELDFKPINALSDSYLLDSENERLSLVITGEGKENAMIHLSYTLAILKERFPKDHFLVHNLGVCGHLQDSPIKFELGEIVNVRTVYAQKNNNEMEFKSFSTVPNGNNNNKKDSKNQSDLISTSERILSPDSSHHLSNFAPLVDREAWAMAYACHKQDTPFMCTKIISDFADGEVCVRVKEKSEEWSDELLRFFLNQEKQISSALPTNKEILTDLHITISQERSLNNLMRALEIKGHSLEQILEKCNYSQLLAEEIRPKEKTKELLKRMADLLNPLEKELRDQLEEATGCLQKVGFKVRFDQGHENDVVHLTTSLENHENINNLIAGLESFDYLKFKEILRGRDV